MTDKFRRVLILEGRLTGHHAVYLAQIAARILADGHDVVMAVAAEDVGNPLIAELLARHAGKISIHPIDETLIAAVSRSWFGDIGRELAYRRLFQKIYKTVDARKKVDQVFLPYLDYCLHAFALLGAPFDGTRWSAICMRPSFHYRHSGVKAPKPKHAQTKERLFFKLLRLRSLIRVFTIDELLSSYVRTKLVSSKAKISYLPDPVDLNTVFDPVLARGDLGIPENARLILAYGAMDERKGLAELLRAFDDKELRQDVSLLVVGKQNEAVTRTLSNPVSNRLRAEGRIFEIDRFVTEAEQKSVFLLSDMVWLGYREHYAMSGVLVLAVASGKPLVSTEKGLIGWYTQKCLLGATVEVGSPKSIVSGINKVVAKLPWTDSTYEYAPHSWAHAGDQIAASLNEN